jgi:ABC-type bacteriocin/lantibiotic exporter with double-glycine peptidase domain
LSRFYEIQKGQILIDGVDIKDVRPQDLRRHIGVVMQDMARKGLYYQLYQLQFKNKEIEKCLNKASAS